MIKRDHVEFAVHPFRPLSTAESRTLALEAERYAARLGLRTETPVFV